MNKVFLDTNFLMDLLVRGDEYRNYAKNVLKRGVCLNQSFYISFLSVANFAYIMRKEKQEVLEQNIQLICSLFEVCDNNKSHILDALQIIGKDFEDKLQYEVAISNQCDCIITRNKKDFSFSIIPVLTPEEFLDSIQE